MPDVDLLHSPCQSATKQHPLALESPFPLALHNRLFRSCFSPPHPTRLWQRPCSPGRCIFPPIPCPSIPFPQCGIPSSSHSPNPKPLLCTNQAHRLERRRMAWGGGHPCAPNPIPSFPLLLATTFSFTGVICSTATPLGLDFRSLIAACLRLKCSLGRYQDKYIIKIIIFQLS